MIEIIGPALNQWDIGRFVKVTDIEADRVHFANKGDSKAVIMLLEGSQAKIPDYLFQTGKQLCVYAVKDRITVESKVFYVNNRERPEQYVYEDDQRNYIYELIANAETATDGANTAAANANVATEYANEAAGGANLAAQNANEATDSANLAAKNANMAADNAKHTAKSLMVIGSAKGNSIYLDDAIDQFLVGLRIFGKTTQLTTKGVQMIPMPYKISGTTVAGVTFEEQADGSVKCTGTATSSAYYPLCGGFAVDAVPIPDWLVEGETYTISGGSSSIDVLLVLYKADGTGKQFAGAPQLTFVMPTGYSYFGIFLLCRNGSTASNTVYPMLNAGPVAADYELYTGGKPSPNPKYPQELVNTADSGSVVVSVTSETETQSMTLATPNGLPGIPVSTGGNYIDANGQQWICDEIDFARGVYVQRTGSKMFDGSSDELWNYESEMDSTILLRMEILESVHVGIVVATDFLCTHFKGAGIYGVDSEGIQHTGQQFYFRISKTALETANSSGFRSFLANSPMRLHYVLAVPIETPLSEEELAAYAALHTYRGNTTVSNDASAHMELEYVMDAKKYIDSIMKAVPRVVSVNLPAAKWTGSGTLYSQVVAIDGITENSQVNLTPSVEQLSIFYDKDICFITENDGGVVTVYVIGQKPQNDYTIPANIVEVIR